MSAYIVLLRAVNVGGTGKLPMTELKSICETAGFRSVRSAPISRAATWSLHRRGAKPR
jgi:uncharacterized protein (DUF1697 family)